MKLTVMNNGKEPAMLHLGEGNARILMPGQTMEIEGVVIFAHELREGAIHQHDFADAAGVVSHTETGQALQAVARMGDALKRVISSIAKETLVLPPDQANG